jgi:3-hydroxyacyl-CoA dehydrogenase
VKAERTPLCARRYGQEAAFCVEEGASPAAVDAALKGFGMAMGVFTMSDLAGTDIGLLVRTARTTSF